MRADRVQGKAEERQRNAFNTYMYRICIVTSLIFLVNDCAQNSRYFWWYKNSLHVSLLIFLAFIRVGYKNNFTVAKSEVGGEMVNCMLLLQQGLPPLRRIKFSNIGVFVLLYGKTLLLENVRLEIIKRRYNNKKIIKRLTLTLLNDTTWTNVILNFISSIKRSYYNRYHISIGTVTRQRTKRLRNRGSIPGKGTRSFASSKRLRRLWGPPSIAFKGYQRHFLER